MVNDDPDLLKITITSDESCVYGYDIKTKAQASQWKCAGRKKHVKFVQMWRFYADFFNCDGVVYHELMP